MNTESKQLGRTLTPEHGAHGDFTPWEPNADAVLAQFDLGKLRNCRILRPAGGLNEFLENKDSPVLVLVGSRGTGKTIALAIKAAKLAAAYPQKDYYTPKLYKPWMNVLQGGSVEISPDQYSLYANHSSWHNLWTLALATHFACLIIKSEQRPEVPNKDRIEAMFGCKSTEEFGPYQFLDLVVKYVHGHTESIAPALTLLLKHNVSAATCREWYEHYVRPILATGKAEHRFTIFVDGIDECLGKGEQRLFDLHGARARGRTNPSVDAENLRAMAHELWTYVQTGFMSATHALREFTMSRCRAYGAARPEAFDRFISNSNLNCGKGEGTLTLTLRYTSEEMAQVFDLHVMFTAPNDLANRIDMRDGIEPSTPEKSVACVALFGDDRVNHPRVFGSDERVLEALIRHTFGAPRDLVMLAKAAKDAAPPAKRRERLDDMIEAVNKKSLEVLSDYIHAVFPMWDTRFEPSLPLISSNVLDAPEAAEIERKFGLNASFRGHSLFGFLYSRGLIGIPRPSTEGSVLDFHTPNGSEIRVPEPYEYLVLHPAFAQWIYEQLPPHRQRLFYNTRVVVGRGLRAPSSLPKARLEFARRADHGGVVCNFDGREIPAPSDDARCGEPLFYGIALAMRRYQTSAVTPEQIGKEVEWLCGRSLVPATWDENLTPKYVQTNLVQKTSDGESHMIKRCKSWLGNVDLRIRFYSGPNTFGLCYGAEKDYRTWKEILPIEIDVRL